MKQLLVIWIKSFYEAVSQIWCHIEHNGGVLDVNRFGVRAYSLNFTNIHYSKPMAFFNISSTRKNLRYKRKLIFKCLALEFKPIYG